jgi:two-component system chemotaxis response regulator CheY
MAYTVLIVDDSPAMRLLIRKVIRLSGFNVDRCLEASDGEDALRVLDRETVDVILTDINMPNMDGEELIRRVRQMDFERPMPVVVVSTDRSDERVAQMKALGARGYLKKPFPPEALRDELQRVLEESDAWI